MSTIEELYKNFGILADAKDKIGEHEKEFLEIVSAVKGGSNEKRLASQFIARFFKHFTSQAEIVLDAMFDLCEDEDINIRRQAIKDLPTLCKETPSHLPRIADVLTQLLQTEEQMEVNMVQSAICNLYRADPKGCLGGLFSQILQGDEEVRQKAIRFMQTKLLSPQMKDAWNKDAEDTFITESKKVLKDVTGEEFVSFISMLSNMEAMQTLKGRQELLDIVIEQADLDQPFEATDSDAVDRLLACIRQALPFFSKNCHADKFVIYICDNVLPVLNQIKPTEVEGEEAVDVQLDMLKLFAEMSCFLGEIESGEERLSKLFDRLIEYMPLPPDDEAENTNENETPKLQFSYVECLMFAFHQMGRKYPDFLTSEDHAERVKDFRIRLQYFARGVQVYIKQLKVALQGKTGEDLKTTENKIKVVALKITNNINTLIKDLFHNPPSYKATMTLSWKPLFTKQLSGTLLPGQKRSNITPITYEGEKVKKAQKADRGVYAPPSGKFSEKAGSYTGPEGNFDDSNSGNGYFNRARGGFRGRGFRGGRGGFRARGRGGFRGGYNKY